MESLLEEIAKMRQSLIDAGTLDGQFEEVENSNKKNDQLFVEPTLVAYFDEAAKMLSNIDDLMVFKPKEFAELDKAVKELRTSSSKVGAKKVRNAVNATRDFIRHEDIKGAKESLKVVAAQLTSLMENLQPYFTLLRLAALAEADNNIK